jgi:hypothetical protein
MAISLLRDLMGTEEKLQLALQPETTIQTVSKFITQPPRAERSTNKKAPDRSGAVLSQQL